MESSIIKRKRWNLKGFIIGILLTFVLIGAIIYGKEHKDQLEAVLSGLVIFLVVGLFSTVVLKIKNRIANK